MLSMPIHSCKKCVLSYKDSTNNLNPVRFYDFDTYDCVMLANEFNSYRKESLIQLSESKNSLGN